MIMLAVHWTEPMDLKMVEYLVVVWKVGQEVVVDRFSGWLS